LFSLLKNEKTEEIVFRYCFINVVPLNLLPFYPKVVFLFNDRWPPDTRFFVAHPLYGGLHTSGGIIQAACITGALPGTSI
jgi:hypothetical protein